MSPDTGSSERRVPVAAAQPRSPRELATRSFFFPFPSPHYYSRRRRGEAVHAHFRSGLPNLPRAPDEQMVPVVRPIGGPSVRKEMRKRNERQPGATALRENDPADFLSEGNMPKRSLPPAFFRGEDNRCGKRPLPILGEFEGLFNLLIRCMHGDLL